METSLGTDVLTRVSVFLPMFDSESVAFLVFKRIETVDCSMVDACGDTCSSTDVSVESSRT